MSESRNDTRSFPKPFGGVPVEYDFPITLIFAIGFMVAFSILVYNLCRKRSGITIIKGITFTLTIERMLVCSMRMAQALNLDVRESWALTEYMQATLGVGFLSLIQEQAYLMLSAATSATRDGLTYDEWMRAAEKNPGIKEARRVEREGFRKWTFKMDWCIIAVQCIQILTAAFANAESKNRDAPWILYCRFVGNVLGTFMAVSTLAAVRRLKDVEGINKTALQRNKITLVTILFVPLSRCFLSFETANTLSTSPSDPGSILVKVAFYLFQLLPELTACLVTATTDYMTLCDAGKWGDYPRRRVEMGVPSNPEWIVGISHKLPRLVPSRIYRWRTHRRQQRASAEQQLREYDPLPYNDREKLLSNASSMGWQSSANLSRLHEEPRQPMAVDMEKQSVKTEWSFSTSDCSTSAASWTSSQATASSKPSSLIADVNLWTPRLPTAFSFGDTDGR